LKNKERREGKYERSEEMKDLALIHEEIVRYGKVSLWGVGKEIRNLANKMDEGERILGVLRVLTSATLALLVATDKRLILMDNHMVYGTDHKDYAYLQISAVDYNTRLFFGQISVEDQAGHTETFNYALNKDLRKFVNVVSLKVAQVHSKATGGGEHQSQGGGMSVADEIEKLWSLVQRGILTREEFERKKSELLAH
jgi:hypothetical protein